MVTVNNILGEHSGTAEFELKGLSTDVKPTGTFSGYTVGENSLFIEMDTGNIYYYNEGAWKKMSTGSGGGGGGGAGLPDIIIPGDEGAVLKVIGGVWAKGGIVELPEVDLDDDGKMLVVDGGKWVPADMLPLVVAASESGGTVTITDGTTISQIYDAAAAKRSVYLEVDASQSQSGIEIFSRYVLTARAYLSTAEQYILTFSQHDTDGQDINERCIMFGPGETTGVLVERE